jgi:Conserved hypothetical protein 95
MRVIAGIYRSRILKSLKGLALRPTSDRLRDRDLLELARREAFALAADSAQHDTMQRLLRQLPAEWQRRYHLARIG